MAGSVATPGHAEQRVLVAKARTCFHQAWPGTRRDGSICQLVNKACARLLYMHKLMHNFARNRYLARPLCLFPWP